MMDFPAGKETRAMDLKQMEMKRDLGEPRKPPPEPPQDSAVWILEMSSEAAGPSEPADLAMVLAVGVVVTVFLVFS